MGVIFQAIMFVASTAYQLHQNKKRQEEADKRKGFELTISGEAAPIPIAYGKNAIGGMEVKHLITDSFVSASDNGDKAFLEGLTNTSITGSKNEFLHVQYVLAQGGISGVQNIKVNDLDYNDEEGKFQHYIRTFNSGRADSIATANGIPSTNAFSGCAFASATFKLDRDDPQYSGVPSMSFLTKGRVVPTVVATSGSYEIGPSSYSNNPARCLLDYLTNEDFGRGLSADGLDLESFYNAISVCDTTVSSGRSISGKVNGSATTRDIPLYECNLMLDSSNTVRDNIEQIMSTMALAELTWTSEGKYKLLVEYPTSTSELNALVDSTHYFTDDDIIRNEINMSWPSASDRFNQYTVSFNNEHEDFKTDSVTWPTLGSTAHNLYLTEDNQQPFKGSEQAVGITDPYHAKARAEQVVRSSRLLFTLELTVSKKGLSLEPGDFINITSAQAGISDEVFRVQSMEVSSDFTVSLVCYCFDHNVLAWNVNDDIAYSNRPTYNWTVDPAVNLQYNYGSPNVDSTSIGYLTWDKTSEESTKALVYFTNDSGNLELLGESASNTFDIRPRTEWETGDFVTFTVKLQTPFGRSSVGVTASGTIYNSPYQPQNLTSNESLYEALVNKATSVRARTKISWEQPTGVNGVNAKEYRVEYHRYVAGEPVVYTLLGITSEKFFIFNEITKGDYSFRVTGLSSRGDESYSAQDDFTVIGLAGPPADPTGFRIQATETGMLFHWNTPGDLDVVSGGTSEIRYIRNDPGISPNWEIAQTIVNNLSGSTNTVTLPVAPGYYLLKHIDSSNVESFGYATALNTFQGPLYNQITTITEAPGFSGSKTNCSVVSGELHKDAGVDNFTYYFDNSVDLGSVESIRFNPKLNAIITDGVTDVSDYDPVSAVTRFAGPVVDAVLNFEIRHTDDDPSGTPTWSDWEPFTVGSFRHRAFEFRLLGVAAEPGYVMEISELSIVADKVDIAKRGTSASSASGDVTVTFDNPFYGGIGNTDVPYVGVNVVGGNSDDTVKITSITASDYSYSVFNNGTRVARNVNWQAVGQ
jgi:hypothetical protein